MASAWLNSWMTAWGNAWGAMPEEPPGRCTAIDAAANSVTLAEHRRISIAESTSATVEIGDAKQT
jgi:hypothetical protein